MKPTLIQGNIKQGILLFAIPLFLSNFFQQLYNTVDTLLIGHFLGDAPLAALGATAAIFELIVQFCSGMSLGFGIVISRYYGAKDTDKLKIAIAESLIFGFFYRLVFIHCFLFDHAMVIADIENTKCNLFHGL